MNALRGTFLGLTLALPLAALPAQQAQEATATQTVTGLGTGTYNVTVIDANGCQASSTAFISELKASR